MKPKSGSKQQINIEISFSLINVKKNDGHVSYPSIVMHVIYLEDAHNTGKNNIQQKPCNIAKKVFYSLQVFMVCFLSGFFKICSRY